MNQALFYLIESSQSPKREFTQGYHDAETTNATVRPAFADVIAGAHKHWNNMTLL